jgi:very-short-patch-repair endonuclease
MSDPKPDPKHHVARQLWRNATDAERKLWTALCGRRLGGHEIRRQQPIGQYVVDFVCHEARLVIEIDGSQHATADETERTARLLTLTLSHKGRGKEVHAQDR